MPCEICNDTKWKKVTLDGVERVTRCDCVRADRANQLIGAANIPPQFRRASFENFIQYDNEKLLNASRQARRFAEEFPAVPKGLMFIGPPGIGKTHLAVAVLKESVRRTGLRGLYCDTKNLLRDIRNTYNSVIRTTEMEVIRPVMEADLLVVDDLGAERFTDWVEETMNLIVNTRYNERRLTIFTSNYEDTPPEDDDLNSLIVKVGFRVHSRLKEMCHFLEFDGADFRDMPPNSGAEDLHIRWKAHPRRGVLPVRSSGQIKSQLRGNRVAKGGDGKGDLKWSGGRAGS